MEYIAHRINTVGELMNLPRNYGAELDLRDDYEGKIYISHNPFERGEFFEDYLNCYRHGTMILNIKSERIEYKVRKMLCKHHIAEYFFLDSSFPMIKLLSEMGERRIALRYSEYEGLDTLTAMAGKVDWVWVDTFSKIPLDWEKFCYIKSLGYKMCLVSPELQGQGEKIAEYAGQLKREHIVFDAICTKSGKIPEWEAYRKNTAEISETGEDT